MQRRSPTANSSVYPRTQEWPLGTYKCPQCLTVFLKPKKQCCQQVRWKCFCGKEMRLRGRKEHIEGEATKGKSPCAVYRSVSASSQEITRETMSLGGIGSQISVLVKGGVRHYNVSELAKLVSVPLSEVLPLVGDTVCLNGGPDAVGYSEPQIYAKWIDCLKFMQKVQLQQCVVLQPDMCRVIEENFEFDLATADRCQQDSEELAVLLLENLANKRVIPMF